MGLMDNIKKAQEMAQQAQQNAGGAARWAPARCPTRATWSTRSSRRRSPRAGFRASPRSSRSARPARLDAGVNKQYAIEVSIELEGGDKYDTTVLQNLTEDAIDSGHYAEGKRFEVKVDPDDKSKALLYGLAD